MPIGSDTAVKAHISAPPIPDLPFFFIKERISKNIKTIKAELKCTIKYFHNGIV